MLLFIQDADKDYEHCLTEMTKIGCPELSEVEFDNLPLTLESALEYLVGEHNKVASMHKDKSVYDTLSYMREQWKNHVAQDKPFF
jgi:hypothetical protein